MKNLILLIMTICLIHVSCDDNRRDDGNDDSNRETESDMRETVSEPFLVTREDVEKDRKKLSEDLNELKAEKRERAGADSTEFDRLVSEAESKLVELGNLADDYKNAADEKRQDVYAEFRELKEELNDDIKEIKARFEKDND